MFQDNIQIRRHGSQDFSAYYDFICAREECYPLPSVKMNLDRGMLDLNGDRVKLSDWPPILDSISINKHLHHIAISSTNTPYLGSGDKDRRYLKPSFKRRVPAIRSKDMTYSLCESLHDCLTVSTSLKTLHLNGLPLQERDLIMLTKGLAKSACLEKLSLANCPIGDEGLEVICQSVKYSSSIRSVDFSGCGITWRGAEHMANIIKHQGMQRHGTAWAESLRYRQPYFEGMRGLRRVTLNCNTLIGDRGAAALAMEVAEDLWLKALDLQKCGLSNVGASHLLQAIRTNSNLCVLDIRCNPLVDKSIVKTILEKVLMNDNGRSSEYGWIKPAVSDNSKALAPRTRGQPASVRRKTVKAARKTEKRSAVAQHQMFDSRCKHLPWRTAARAQRHRGMSSGGAVMDHVLQGVASVRLTVESASEEEGDDDDDEEEVVAVLSEKERLSQNIPNKMSQRKYELIQMELRECRLKLTEERRARLEAESRLRECELEIARLRNSISKSGGNAATGFASGPTNTSTLEDEAVLKSIESSFNKFHAFLDLFKDAGLGQLVEMAGIDESDFNPLGKPQLSSTFGCVSNLNAPTPIGNGAGSLNHLAGGDSFTVGRVTEDLNKVSLHQPSLSARESTRKARPPDVSLEPVVVPAVASLEEDQGPEEFLIPDTMDDSGSERSVHSRSSSRNVLLGNTFRTQPIRQVSHGNSHQSDSHRSISRQSDSHRSISRQSDSHQSNSHQSDPYRSDSHRSIGSGEKCASYSPLRQSSHSSRSNGQLSGRSSVSDICSKAESVASARSGTMRFGRLVAVGQSDSDGSDGKASPPC
ncbi:centrosomal protein of 78 kDa [Neosynchiropus ocellatus]